MAQKQTESGGWVFYKGDWWFVVREEPRDMSLIENPATRERKSVSERVLLKQSSGESNSEEMDEQPKRAKRKYVRRKRI